MKLLTSALVATSLLLAPSLVIAKEAKSEKQAKKVTHHRQALFSLIGSNMGKLGAMAKGKIPLDGQVVKTNAKRINQLSHMISDYSKVNTSGYKLKTDALPAIWQKPKQYNQRIMQLTKASKSLKEVALSGDEKAIKKAIRAVGKACGSCHDDFTKD